MYTNQATIPNSLSSIELEIEYYNSDGAFNKVRISSVEKSHPKILSINYQQLNVPKNIGARETVSGWMTFKLPKDKNKNIRIDTYSLTALTPTGDKI